MVSRLEREADQLVGQIKGDCLVGGDVIMTDISK